MLQAFHSIAKCVAALTIMNTGEAVKVVNQFVSDIKVRLYCIATSYFFHLMSNTRSLLWTLRSVLKDLYCHIWLDFFLCAYLKFLFKDIMNFFVLNFQNPASSESIVIFALLALGEIGKHV